MSNEEGISFSLDMSKLSDASRAPTNEGIVYAKRQSAARGCGTTLETFKGSSEYTVITNLSCFVLCPHAYAT